MRTAEPVYVCTKEAPWNKTLGDRAQHPDAVCTYDGGWEQEYERYKCPHCDLSFKVMLGQ